MTNEALIPFHAVIACRPEVKDLELGETLRFKKGGGEFELMEASAAPYGSGPIFILLIDGVVRFHVPAPEQLTNCLFPQKETP